jgi:MoxR-like ATPase
VTRETNHSIRGDRRDGTYVSNAEIDLAIEVALATGRPLLLRGATGAGKSSLAIAEAKKRRWRYYEQTITSRTQARELLWEVDLLARMHDAKQGSAPPVRNYIRPGILWWAINRDQAVAYLKRIQPGIDVDEADPNMNVDDDGKKVEHQRAVVLLDEIDKADPDVPNNLLVPLGSYRFVIDEAVETIRLDRNTPPLIIITSNGERELPPAFLRRCVEYSIPDAGKERLLDIAVEHFKDESRDTLGGMLDDIVTARPSGWTGAQLPSPAEFIDCVNAIRGLPMQTRANIAGIVVWKQSSAERP